MRQAALLRRNSYISYDAYIRCTVGAAVGAIGVEFLAVATANTWLCSTLLETNCRD